MNTKLLRLLQKHAGLLFALLIAALFLTAQVPQPPGPPGPPGSSGASGATGATGATGAPGQPAFTTTTANFTQPASSGTVTVTMANTTWIVSGQYLFVAAGGFYTAATPSDSTHVVLTNLGYPGNASPTTVINSGSGVSAGGVQGASGASGATGATGATGAAGSGGGGLVTYAALSVVLSGGTTPVYVPLGGDGLGSTTETNVQMKVQPATEFQNFCVTLSAAPGAGNSIVVTLRDNAANTSITATVSGASATSACDSTHSVTNSAGDLMDWSIVPSGTIALYTPNVMISVQAGSGAGSSGEATRGIFASRPSAGTAGTGATYYSTDVAIISQSNGTSWADWVMGQPVTLPSLTTFTGQNMAGGGGATLVTNGVIDMVVTGQNGDQLHGQFITLPATPFTVDACFALNALTIQFNDLGLYVSDGTKLVTFDIGTSSNANGFMTIQIANWNLVSSFNGAAVTSQPFFPGANQYCLRWNDNGTNVLFSMRIPPSTTWWQFASLGRTAFLTPTQIGWFMDVNTVLNNPVGTIYSWLSH